MAFEVYKPRKMYGHNGDPKRREEMVKMFALLDEDRELAATCDSSLSLVHTYAKKLGYKVTVLDNKDGTCEVQVVESPIKRKGE